MAGNFLKYGAAEATFGSKNAGDLPVDAHELIALCAPRPTFISYGVPEKGDAKWLDQQGSFMAAVAAGRSSGCSARRTSATSDDYHTAKMPPVNVGLLDGQLAWRQHDGGHTDGPNWKYFIPWADKMLAAKVALPPAATAPRFADQRARRSAAIAHRRELHDSPTSSCSRKRSRAASMSTSKATPSRAAGAPPTIRTYLANWKQNFFGWNAADFGWGADTHRRTSSGGSRTANSMASTRKSSCCWPAPTTSAA